MFVLKLLEMAEFQNGLSGSAQQFPSLETHNPTGIQREQIPVLVVPQRQSNPVLPPRTVQLRSETGYNIISYRDDSINLEYEGSMDEFIASMFRAETAFLAQIKKNAKLDTIPALKLPANVPIRGPQCSISYDEIISGEQYDICNTCNNVFKSEHLTKWIKKSCTCPICRTPISERCQSTMP